MANTEPSAENPSLPHITATDNDTDNEPLSPLSHNQSSPSPTSAPHAPLLAPPQDDASRSRTGSFDTTQGSVVTDQSDLPLPSPPFSSTLAGSTQNNSNDHILNDPDALKPDVGKEATFSVENNPFAFSPGELNKLFDPKSLSAFYKLGGLDGLEKGLRSDRKAGLSADEIHLSGQVSFDEAVRASKNRGPGDAAAAKDSNEKPTHASGPPGKDHREPQSFADRIRVFGDNRLPEKRGKSLLQIMWITYNDKVLMLLTAAAVVSLAIGLYQTFGVEHEPGEAKIEWVEGVAIIAAILIVVVVGSLNDYQKERQFAKLNRKKQDRSVKVCRSGRLQEISVYDILVGDLVHIEPGDMVPVDGVLVEGFNVKCDESQATGESDIIKKQPADEVYQTLEAGGPAKKLDPFIQSGGRVMEGIGMYMCTSTGIHSSYGRTLMALSDEPEMTPLQAKLNVIAEYIAKIGGAAGLSLFIVLFIKFLAGLRTSGATPSQKGMNFIEIFIVVVTIIVVAVPEGLPLAVTLALAFATKRMIKDNNLVRHLKACEVMGNATAICSDKTGTLTQNKMQVVAGMVGVSHRFGDVPGRFTDPGAGGGKSEAAAVSSVSAATASELVTELSAEVRDLVKKSIALNSTAFEGDVEGVKTFIGSKTESAMLLLARDHFAMESVSWERENAHVLQMIPFDSGRKCMGVVVSVGKCARLYIKGASEIVLSKCTQLVRDPSREIELSPLSSQDQEVISQQITDYASRSLRTIGMAFRDFEEWPPRQAPREDGGGGSSKEVSFDYLFQDLAFLGVVGIQDPLREGVAEAVRLCQHAGVCVRMVTGDNIMTARAIAKECGIMQENSVVMEGPTFRNLSEEEQHEVIPRLHVLARSSPEDKRILVMRLKEKNEIVAVTGDGTNDAPALKMADVGFSMGIAGTEVAKEASAIILMDDNFSSIVKALKWGRAVNDAVKRFLQFQLTVNITAVLLTFVSAVSNDTESSVLTAVQLLWVNLIMDTLAALALATDPPADSILDRKPEPRHAFIITPTMWKMIVGQAIYQLAITFLLYFGRKRVLPDLDPDVTSEMVDTLVFNTFVWMQVFNQWNNRRLDNRFNIFEGVSRNWIFVAVNVAMCGLQVLIIFVGGPVFQINKKRDEYIDPQGPVLWAVAIVLGLISIPVGMVIRLIPDSVFMALVPKFLKNRAASVSLEEAAAADAVNRGVNDQWANVNTPVLASLLEFRGGRYRHLFSRAEGGESKADAKKPEMSVVPMTTVTDYDPHDASSPRVEDGDGGGGRPRPDRQGSYRSARTPTGGEGPPHTASSSRRVSRSSRSRSNSAFGASTVMAGMVAAGVAASWSPLERKKHAEAERDS